MPAPRGARFETGGGRWAGRASRAGLLVLVAGCATVQQLERSATAESFERLNEELEGRQVEVGVTRPDRRVVLGSDIETRSARELRLTPDAATWLAPATGNRQRVPLQALAWVGWPAPEGARLVPALRAAGLGAVATAAAGALLGLVLGRGGSTCLAIDRPPSDLHSLPYQCISSISPPAVGLGALAGAAAGALGGALLGAVLGDRQRVELRGWVSPPGPSALP